MTSRTRSRARRRVNVCAIHKWKWVGSTWNRYQKQGDFTPLKGLIRHASELLHAALQARPRCRRSEVALQALYLPQSPNPFVTWCGCMLVQSGTQRAARGSSVNSISMATPYTHVFSLQSIIFAPESLSLRSSTSRHAFSDSVSDAVTAAGSYWHSCQ